MSQWDNVELSNVIERRQRTDDYNRQASAALPVNDNAIVVETKTVVNRRTGSRTTKSIYRINEDRRNACVNRYWTHPGHSNSLGFEYKHWQSLSEFEQALTLAKINSK